MDFLEATWDVIWFFFWTFAFIAYLMVLFSIIGDIFRDNTLNGWAKAAWMLFLIFVPFLTSLVYLIARGKGMAARQMQAAQRNQQATEEYVRSVAGSGGSADEIVKAKALFDSGTITGEEYAALKAKALR
ncbi:MULTISPECIES: SHOCT domain-containing protein [Cryobacterium]|uniref:Cardiolipin synthase N-terminal domain-containing protein n=1 Tax=Cryobacterium breve TaxID=1259258 RepID=A0ABY2J2Y4_9MICO|nr:MULTISPECIES: SHOCT domain-containing protein [Cryobacterium]TFC90972.1 hypothetical protein E3T20_15215 [Cryobacterium sp. TmT3-12]TFC99291.1 hypothetical protein E3O65_06350 [Cryobacterium breve]